MATKKKDFYTLEGEVVHSRTAIVKLEDKVYFVSPDNKTEANFKSDVNRAMVDITELSKSGYGSFEPKWLIFILQQHYKWFSIEEEVATSPENLDRFKVSYFK